VSFVVWRIVFFGPRHGTCIIPAFGGGAQIGGKCVCVFPCIDAPVSLNVVAETTASLNRVLLVCKNLRSYCCERSLRFSCCGEGLSERLLCLRSAVIVINSRTTHFLEPAVSSLIPGMFQESTVHH
jgi:hypothetical protein